MREAGIEGFPFKGRPYAKIDIRTLVRLRDIQDGFSRVPVDKYVSDGTRYKDLCRFSILNGTLTKAPHGNLFHPINANSYGNNSSRTYSEVPACDLDALKSLVEIFVRVAGVSNGQEVLVQRQRVINDSGEASKTVREGPHRDGVEKLAIFCVQRAEISGGVSFLYGSQRSVEYAALLEPGDILFIDDIELLHDTTPILTSKTGAVGYRDVIILTSPSGRAEESETQGVFEEVYYGT